MNRLVLLFALVAVGYATVVPQSRDFDLKKPMVNGGDNVGSDGTSGCVTPTEEDKKRSSGPAKGVFNAEDKGMKANDKVVKGFTEGAGTNAQKFDDSVNSTSNDFDKTISCDSEDSGNDVKKTESNTQEIDEQESAIDEKSTEITVTATAGVTTEDDVSQ